MLENTIHLKDLTAEAVADAVYEAIRYSATHLRADYLEALIRMSGEGAEENGEEHTSKEVAESHAASTEPVVSNKHAASTEPVTASLNERSAAVIQSILRNAELAARDAVPLCQDTGTVWVCLEVSPHEFIPGNIFSRVNEAVAAAYTDGALRMSVVNDALFDRSNTTTNTPAFCELKIREEGTHSKSGTPTSPRARLHVLLKGGGSDNASRVVMLPPGAGREGVKQTVLECVREKAANACPPLVIGLGVGATFDKVAGLAKHALLREIGSPAQSEEARLFEEELLEEINTLNLGPGALGGYPTTLAVHLETAPCHIAALPVAINMGCCAMRSVSIDLES
jgi:fumarate hydratase class I/fumarate hydratase subunit alpha